MARRKQSRDSDYGGCLPTREQALLLRASLLKGDAALEAFREWKSRVRLDRVDPGSYRLFPLLYANLKSTGVDDPLTNIFEWVYHTTRNNNGILLSNMSQLLREFSSARIQFMLLKGAALILMYYKDSGLRPMMDVDILVRTREARDAIELVTRLGWNSSITPLKGFSRINLLSSLGWRPKQRALEDFSKEFFSVRHGQDFVHPDSFTIDLHWHVLHGYNGVNADSFFWEGASKTELDGLPVAVLSPTDQLLHVCSHGVSWNHIPPVRWVADAVMIVNSAPEWIDWGRLTAASVRHGKVFRVRKALHYLRSYLDVSVPDTVLRELENFPVSKAERLEYEVRTRPPGILDGLVELCFLYECYSRENADRSAFRRIAGFPKFLEHVFGMESAWHLVLYSAFEFVRRTGLLLRSLKDSLMNTAAEG